MERIVYCTSMDVRTCLTMIKHKMETEYLEGESKEEILNNNIRIVEECFEIVPLHTLENRKIGNLSKYYIH